MVAVAPALGQLRRGADEQEVLPRLTATLAGRYDIVRELGRGGMATMFLSTDANHEREVAIKVLPPEV